MGADAAVATSAVATVEHFLNIVAINLHGKGGKSERRKEMEIDVQNIRGTYSINSA